MQFWTLSRGQLEVGLYLRNVVLDFKILFSYRLLEHLRLTLGYHDPNSTFISGSTEVGPYLKMYTADYQFVFSWTFKINFGFLDKMSTFTSGSTGSGTIISKLDTRAQIHGSAYRNRRLRKQGILYRRQACFTG